MAKNIEHIQHVKSNVVLEGKPKLPQASNLVEGELAINYADGVETISIKNSSGDIVTFSSDNYYTEQKLGSGFTGENSANTVTSVIEENERIISSALNDLNESKLDASAYTPIEIDQVVDSGTSASTNAVSTSAVYEFIQHYPPSANVDQVLDDSVSASTNPVASKAVYSALTETELVWTNAYGALSGVISSHTEDTTVHVTSSDKAKLGSITGNVGTMAYENASSYSSATEVSSAFSEKANTIHTHEASCITAMTGYEMASSSASVLTTDSLLQVIGKLEKRISMLENSMQAQPNGDIYAEAGDY